MALADFIRFGNGRMATKVYKWMLPLCRIHSNKAKYATEALYMYTSLNYLLSPRMAHLVTWNRFCCTVNARGRNIPMDRRLEHLNRLAKDLMKRAGHQNLSDKLAAAIGAAIQPMHDLGISFDRSSGVPLPSTYIDRSEVNAIDEKNMLRILQKAKVFQRINGRVHPNFFGMKANPYDDIKVNNLRRYVIDWGQDYLGYQRALYSRMYPVEN